ncbi:peptide chain release factor PrfB3, chloroplastic [Magnolia sinica]|uniref:peptide chain release factor PrfB3, chloroplastic n=1 Tax=Magnolia sinica TaxID=86752 RepID=UPI00265953B5|nr:peptide chain release factor PrfB3, chloroplastic [Magnolia sinica]
MQFPLLPLPVCEEKGEKMKAESVTVTRPFGRMKWGISSKTHSLPPNHLHFLFSSSSSAAATIRASSSSQSNADDDKVYKELGLFSLRRKIEDAVVRAEMMTPMALELEEARKIEQEETIRKYNLWDDLAKSNESLIALADTTKVVDALKDLKYKTEEAKLITQLAEMDAINHRLFKQAYNASVYVSKFLDHYEMSKHLCGPYDMEGACVTIEAGSGGMNHEIWAEKLLAMYIKWGEKQGYRGRVIEKYLNKGGGIKSATIEFESKYAYGYLCGERGTHQMVISSLHASVLHESILAGVDVIPLFLEKAPDLQMEDGDLEVASILACGEERLGCRTELAVNIRHIPTGINVQCSGERSHFANNMKALNRLKARLLVIATEQGVSNVKQINREAIADMWKQEARRYVFHPYKLVRDVKTGVQLPDLTSVLDGNLEPLIVAHINIRQTRDGIS